MSFLSKLWDGIKHLFEGLRAETKKVLPIIRDVVNKIKEFEDSNIPDVITALIPGTADDALNAKFRQWLPALMLELESDNIIAQLPNVEDQVKAIIAKIQGSSPNKQKVFYTGLAALLTQCIADDGKFSWGDALVVSKYVYDNKITAQPVAGEEAAGE
jgi:hypothetical protein